MFFVNNVNILDKTRDNFINETSEKYLFNKGIEIDGKRVFINVVNNFSEARDECINVVFNTVQGLYSLFTNERENSLTFEDLKEHKIVYLADEAHHLNAQTKSELEDENSWEGVIKRAFEINDENLMLEFTATIPKDEKVQEKYRDKVIFEYALKQFYNDKFSKRIFLLKYNGTELEERFLGSILLNLYRMRLAEENGVFLKPVVLYKSKTIKESKENELKFKHFVQNLQENEVREFIETYANLSKNEDEDEALFKQMREFFVKKFKMRELCAMIKEFFSVERILNVNENDELKRHQILLNNLESKSNEIRVIFAVDKLNEGWDVLNLFDIVRLNEGMIKESTREAQLIGRGARYFPFKIEQTQEEFKRKFDGSKSEIRILEILSYHAASDGSEFITKLNDELVREGLRENQKHKITLKIKPQIKENSFFNEAFFATNSRRRNYNEPNLFSQRNLANIKESANATQVPLINVKGVIEDEMLKDEIKENESFYKECQIREIVPKIVLLKAMNRLYENYEFSKISRKFGVKSKDEFIEKFIYALSVKIHSKQQNLDNKAVQLKIAQILLQKFAQGILKELDSFVVQGWEAKKLSEAMGDKEIYREKAPQEKDTANFEWFVFDKFVGNDLEKDFLNYIESNKELINGYFKDWLLIRNERFAEFVVYDHRERLENGDKNEHYGDRFEPDFYFLGRKKGEKSIIMQCIMEPKGEHLKEFDAWKEAFLENLLMGNLFAQSKENQQVKVKLNGLPFFKDKNNEKFKKKFGEFLEK